MVERIDSQLPELYARLDEIKKTGLPQGYLGNIGIFGQEIARYDKIFPEAVVSLDAALTILEKMGLAGIINKDGPRDYSNALAKDLGEFKDWKKGYVGNNTNFGRWDGVGLLGRNFDVHLLSDPSINSVFYYITYSNQFKQDVKTLQKVKTKAHF